MRLCKHKTVKWSTVLASLPGGRINNNYIRGAASSDTAGEKLPSRLPFSVEPDLRIVCTHASHIPGHHHSAISAIQGSMPAALASGAPTGIQTFPLFVVHDLIVSGTRHKAATWTYSAHLDLTGLGDANNNDAIPAQTFRGCVSELRKDRHSPARLIAPEDYPGILHELRGVDPTRCGCLEYPSLERTTQTARGPCQDHEVVRKLCSRVNDWDNLRIRLESCDCRDEEGGKTRCLKIVYSRTIRLQGYYIDPAPDWRPGLFRGRRRRDIDIRFQDAFRAESVPYGWYLALYLPSFGPCQGTRRRMWCRNRQCRLHPSFQQNYIASEEMNSECAYGCENSLVNVGVRNESFFEVPSKEQRGRWRIGS